MKIGILIQARSLSSRFPLKVLKNINDIPLIVHLYNRLRKSKVANELAILIPDGPNDYNLEQVLISNGCKFFKGSEENVLSRYYAAAKYYKLNHIVRITADCPLACPDLIDQMLKIYLNDKSLGYFSNTINPTFPDGLDVEIFDFVSLEKAFNDADDNYQKEHVTPYMKQNSSIKSANHEFNVDVSGYRLTIDYQDDLEFLESLLKTNPDIWNKNFESIIQILLKNEDNGKTTKVRVRDEGSKMSNNKKLWDTANRNIVAGTMLFSKNPNLHCPNKWPSYFKKAKGCEITDIDGQLYLDFSYMGIGTNLLGYGHPEVDLAVTKAVVDGNMSTLNCAEEVFLSEKLLQMHPWSEKLFFCRTGGEANTIALRLSRVSSKRRKVAICGYHGWHDWYLSANISEKNSLNEHLLTGLKTEGIPKDYAGLTRPFSYGDFIGFDKAIECSEVGTVIMEVARNKELDRTFLQYVRDRTASKEINLIFDECSSGFRKNFGGLFEDLGFFPDAVMYGKALGNGYAINVVIGSSRFMNNSNETFISSTFWSERIGSAAALAVLNVMERSKSYDVVHNKGLDFRSKLGNLAESLELNILFSGIPAITNFHIENIENSVLKTFIAQEMLKEGYLTTNTIYFSTAHDEEKTNYWLKKLEVVLKKIKLHLDKKLDLREAIEGDICMKGFGRLN